MSNMPTEIFGELVLGYCTNNVTAWNTAGVDGGANAAFYNVISSDLPLGFLSFGSQAVVDGFDPGAILVAREPLRRRLIRRCR